MISNPRGMIPQPVFARCLILVLLLARGAAAEPVVLRHVTIVDRGTRRADATLVVDQGKIASIGAADAEAPRGARVVDCAGQFVIPGLWDMHVHLSFAGEPALLDLVAAGVTGVRDMGGDVWQLDGWRREIAEGVRIGPTIVQAGPLLDGPKPGLPHRITVASAEERPRSAAMKRLLEGVARMRAAGVKLLAGSDMAGSFWPTDVHDELRLLVQAGLSPAEALASATSEAAAFLGLQDETGSVVPGKAADLVLLRGDPLADIRNTRAIAAVVVRGRYFSSDQVRLLAVGARSR